MNQTCKVCGEPAAGFHFGAFTCEGCKSFFGRSYNNLSSISECKNNGKCIIDKKNRTTCKACRLRKCYTVGMSKGGSRYGRRSNWFKIHCLLQEQQQQALEAAGKVVSGSSSSVNPTNGFSDMAAAAAVAAAKQHMQQLNPHMGGLLGYPGYHIPEMMQGSSPFMSAAATGRHPADAAAAAAIPFFSMMNSLPNIGSSPSAFQLPPHLLFPSAYHSQGAAAAAAAADAAYRSEMFKHRQSVDSAASGESHRFSPAATHTRSNADEEGLGARSETEVPRHSPELCVSGDDDEEERALSSHSHHDHTSTQCDSPAVSQSATPAVTLAHHIHSPIAIRAMPPHRSLPTSSPSASFSSHPHHSPQPTTPTPAAIAPATTAVTPTPASTASDRTALSFAAKMQALSPVSICSIGGETLLPGSQDASAAGSGGTDDQDCPMDLSMKATTSSSSVQSCNTNTSAADCDLQSVASEEELRAEGRRKFFHISNEHESDTSSDASGAVGAGKRQKLIDDSYNASGFAHSTTATSLRGIFVCV